MTKDLSEHYFGDLEAFDEAELHKDFFRSTFVAPNSISTNLLRNNMKFIIIGRKGTGKTAVQMSLGDKMIEEGYFVHYFRFFYDLRSDDYSNISKTQGGISYIGAEDKGNIFTHYDFRDIWERVIFQKIATHLRN